MFDFDHGDLHTRLKEYERFAKSIGSDDPRRNSALMILAGLERIWFLLGHEKRTGRENPEIMTWLERMRGWRLEAETLKLLPDAQERVRQREAHKENPGGQPRKEINERELLAEVGRGTILKELVGKWDCSVTTLSNILKKHGGVAAVRKQYRRKQAGR